MNYEIIKDKEALNQFIDWLPELQRNEKYYVSLFARKKYSNNKDDLKSDKCQLKRFISDKKHLFQKIKQLEIEQGYYQFDGNPVPTESLSLYITPNPRDIELATKKSLIDFANKVTEKYSGYNPQALILSNIQKSCTNKYFIDFDFDNINYDSEFESKILECINKSSIGNVVITRGGFHLLIDVNKIESKYKKSWYNEISKLSGCDVKGDTLIPVPGCVQGNFVPKMIRI